MTMIVPSFDNDRLMRQKEAFMKIGYVRVSKLEQHEALQVDALSEVGCEKWFLDKIRFHQFNICIYILVDLTREARRLTSTYK